MINRAIILGRLTKEVELSYSAKDNSAYAKFSVACKRDFVNVTDFFDCIAFGKTAEFISQHFAKGQKIAIEGRLATNRWTDKNGNARVSYEIVCDSVDFADGKKTTLEDIGDDDGELPWV